MSWVKKRGQTTATAAVAPPPVQMYNPNQHPNQENQWQQPTHDNWYNQTQFQAKPEIKNQANYWQQPYHQQQQSYNQNSQQYSQYQEHPGYYQNNPTFQQQPYANLQYNQQYTAQNNLYGTQAQQQTDGDGWSSTWGWGDEDNSNIQTPAQQNTNNVVEHSFANDETWNWTVDDSNSSKSTSKSVKAENEADLVKGISSVDRLTGKRGKLETPQWSVESQMSQESSDDILQTSESDKSRMLSRSSTISHSPISGQDISSGNHLDNIQIKEEPNFVGSHHFENKEILSQVKQEVVQEPSSSNVTPPPPLNTHSLPPPSQQGSDDGKANPYKRNTGLSHKSANKFRSNNVTPPENRPLNTFQPSFHAQSVNLETLPDNSEQPDSIPQTKLHSIRKVNNKPQQWAENNEAPINDRNQYLETAQLSDVDINSFNQVSEGSNQDNDTLPPPGLRRMVPGRMEQHENNLVSGHFGDENEPPPGLSRLVPGQLETNPTLSGNSLQSDNSRQTFEAIEPPEGLHRMIPGESSSPESSLRQQSYQLSQSTERRQEDDSESEFNEINAHAGSTRSATIGADTPPAVPTISATTSNRSETIGADTSPDPVKTSQDLNRPRGVSASSNENRRIGTSNKKNKKQNNRRDSIEGQIEGGDIGSLVNSVRNMTVGDHPSDENNGIESNVRKHSRQESSDSEHEPRGKSPMDRRDRRYRDKEEPRDRDRNRSRYSPDDYRDKKYERRRYKDRRYEEDTDYYSDKERERRHRDERDYDRKYSSLKKDKEKDRRRRDDRREYGRDPRKNDYYYGRYDDDFENESRSRASSRSDSMHDSYRDRDRGHERDRRDRRHRDKDRHRRHRDPFNPYTQGFGYDIYSQYYQQYHYYENLRKTNPQAYAQLYRKYYQEASGETPSYGGEDRASVHSGRSSANDELAKDRYTRQSYYSQTSLPHLGGYYRGSQTHSISGQYGLDDSSFVRTFDQTDNSLNYEDPHLTTQRLTPAKFATAHIKASISSGKLVKILPHYPLDGQTPTVELCNLESLLYNDEDYQELKRFPGPLVKGTTHKKTIIEYCESKIKNAAYNLEINDRDSYILMWELLILLIRQNGMVVGADIAELLLKNRSQDVPQRPPSVVSSVSSTAAEGLESINQPNTDSNNGTSSNLKEEEITNKFREYLLYGSGKEALEWAMKHGLWGHALFLASKLDKRTYANVLMRFANGLSMNDPLQTLYQLLSGRTPAAVTCVADEKWGDWRPHLAMILSNSTQRPELNCKAITILGDTLMGRGSLYAAQFCYLMAEVGFSKYGSAEAKLVLLGSNHNNAFLHFATNEAIHMTEIYEYARSLNDDDFALANFQYFKYLLSTRLADVGLLEKSLSYLEKIANFIVKNPGVVESSLINDVALFADRLKYYDPVGDGEEDTDFGDNLDTSRPDNSWLKDLRRIQNDHNMGLITQDSGITAAAHVQEEQNQQVYAHNQDVWQQQQLQQQQYDQYQTQQWSTNDQQQSETTTQIEYPKQSDQQHDGYLTAPYQDQQQYWTGQQTWNPEHNTASLGAQEPVEQQQNYYSSIAQSEPDEVEKKAAEDIPPQPQISLPNQQQERKTHKDESLQNEQPKKDVPVKTKPNDSGQDKQSGNGWFGGIFSKLSLKPKNQMKLPDDKNPTILWDPDKKRWVNTDEDNDDGGNEFKPPPKMSEIAPKIQPQSFNSVPQIQPNLGPDQSQQSAESNGNIPKSTQPNIFKRQRGRNLKKSYIDVFNPNSKQTNQSSLPPPAPMGTIPAAPTQMNFFIPQPVNDPNAPTDFLTPAPPMQYDENSQMSRWSSASSLSKEVQSYTMHKPNPRR